MPTPPSPHFLPPPPSWFGSHPRRRSLKHGGMRLIPGPPCGFRFTVRGSGHIVCVCVCDCDPLFVHVALSGAGEAGLTGGQVWRAGVWRSSFFFSADQTSNWRRPLRRGAAATDTQTAIVFDLWRRNSGRKRRKTQMQQDKFKTC